MELRIKSRKKPWLSKKQGRNTRNKKTGELIKPFSNSLSDKSFYKTSAWKATREAVLYRDPSCVWCLNLAKLTPASEADHVIPMELCQAYDVDPLDKSNIVGSCRSCNARRAAYSSRGVFYDSIDKWVNYLRRKHVEKLNS